MLTDTQKEIIRAFAESGMNRTEASRQLFKHYNTVYYQLIRIKEKTGLNPWDFFDLHELLRMAGVTDYVDVVRCKDCIYSRPLNREDDYEAFFGEDSVWCTHRGSGEYGLGFCSLGERDEDEKI